MSNYVYKGCFRDSSDRRLKKRGNNVSSVEECKIQAINNNKKLFGLQFNGECWMDDSYSNATSLGQVYDDCGNLGTSWSNKLYVNMPPESVNGYDYQGCYNDNSTRTIPNKQKNVSSVKECSDIVQSLNQNVFGVQYNGQCFTGNNENDAMSLGYNDNYDSCGTLGGLFTNLVYSKPNKTNKSYSNQNIFIYYLIGICLIIIIILSITYFILKKTNNRI